jgi:hypothetical protein
MALATHCTQLDNELDVLSRHLRDFAAAKSPVSTPAGFSLLDECLLEGLLSRIWQSWCKFCRECVIESCLGTTCSNGNVVAGLPDAVSEAQVSGAAIRAKRHNKPPYWGAPNTELRYEPTWGDVDVLATILTCLRPVNYTQLAAAFSSGHPSAKALQIIRNGAAHNHPQKLIEILALRSTHVAFPISHPVHALFWIEPLSADFLVTHAIEELKGAALAAIA